VGVSEAMREGGVPPFRRPSVSGPEETLSFLHRKNGKIVGGKTRGRGKKSGDLLKGGKIKPSETGQRHGQLPAGKEGKVRQAASPSMRGGKEGEGRTLGQEKKLSANVADRKFHPTTQK